MLIQHRKSLKRAAAVAVACCTFMGSLTLAQIRNRPREDQDQAEQPAPPKRRAGKTPRAVGVLEITGGDARLIPVSIMIDGKFYDASVYKADPQPMAVQPETVYEGQKTGEPAGTFTVLKTQEVNGNWIGVGLWERMRVGEAAPTEVKVGAPDANRPRGMDDDEGPPKLRRPGSPAADRSASPTTSAPSSQPSAPATAPSTASTTESGQKPSSEAKPSGGPSLRRAGDKPVEPPPTAEDKPAAQPDTTTAAKQSAPSEDDSNRPVLRRGNAGGEQADKIPGPAVSAAKAANAGHNATSASNKSGNISTHVGFTDTIVAVSDEGGPTPRSFTMMLRPDERTGYEQKLSQYASDAIRKFAVSHPIRSRQAPDVALTDIQMHVFDVNSSNEPVLVFTARAPETAAVPAPAKPAARSARASQPPRQPAQSALPPQTTLPSANSTAFQYYVTVVARVDVNGDVRKLFEAVTDTSHLDAVPRLQLIDCVDANGDGVGELLFRENYDRSRAFAIYRVGMDQLWQLFEGAQASFSAGQ